MNKILLNIKGVKQKTNCCGPACLSMILSFYGYNVKQSQIKKECQVGRQRGMYTRQAIAYLKNHGISCSMEKKVDIDKYFRKPRPLLLGFEHHFVLMVGLINGHIIVIDPATGRKSIVGRDYLNNVKDYTVIKKITYER